MIVWIWSAAGPGDFTGVSDDPGRARDAAGACIAKGLAGMARVESATARLGAGWINEGYIPCGNGWTGCPDGAGRIAWQPFAGAS